MAWTWRGCWPTLTCANLSIGGRTRLQISPRQRSRSNADLAATPADDVRRHVPRNSPTRSEPADPRGAAPVLPNCRRRRDRVAYLGDPAAIVVPQVERVGIAPGAALDADRGEGRADRAIISDALIE